MIKSPTSPSFIIMKFSPTHVVHKTMLWLITSKLSVKKNTAPHLSSSSRTPGTAAHNPPASQALESAGQLSEQRKNVIWATKCSHYIQLTHQNTCLQQLYLHKWKSYGPWLSQRCHVNWTVLPSSLGLYQRQEGEEWGEKRQFRYFGWRSTATFSIFQQLIDCIFRIKNL